MVTKLLLLMNFLVVDFSTIYHVIVLANWRSFWIIIIDLSTMSFLEQEVLVKTCSSGRWSDASMYLSDINLSAILKFLFLEQKTTHLSIINN